MNKHTDRKENVQRLIQELANEIYGFIKENESSSVDGWVPTIKIKNELQKFPSSIKLQLKS